jgi:cell division protein FtsW
MRRHDMTTMHEHASTEDRHSPPRRLPARNSAGGNLVLVTLGLMAIGTVMVWSAMVRVADPAVSWYSRVEMRHIGFVIAGATIVMFGGWFNYRRLWSERFPLLAAAILAVSLLGVGLAFLPGLGRSEHGFHRWLRLGSVSFQPSELVKLSILVFLSAWLSRPGVNPRSFAKTFLPALLVVGLAMGATVTESVSTAALVGLASVVTLIFAGVPWYYLLILMPPGAAVFYKFVYSDPYHWARVTAIANPWDVSNPAAYQARESLMAILHGGWGGVGLGNGMIKMGYLPEAGSDFIFAIICDEMGFIGGAMLIGLIGLWIWNAGRAAVRAQDRFGSLMAGSLAFLIAIQSILNISVALAVTPTTGQGLPFVSSGGTSLLMSATAAALIVSVGARRTPRDLV